MYCICKRKATSITTPCFRLLRFPCRVACHALLTVKLSWLIVMCTVCTVVGSTRAAEWQTVLIANYGNQQWGLLSDLEYLCINVHNIALVASKCSFALFSLTLGLWAQI